jgi:NAD(P)-dependent dehydrogenase (short-subunit alcohol dehydrogenase family)
MRINLMIPGPVNTPQRNRSHPGEDKSALPQPEELARQLLYLMSPDSREVRGRIFEGSIPLPA